MSTSKKKQKTNKQTKKHNKPNKKGSFLFQIVLLKGSQTDMLGYSGPWSDAENSTLTLQQSIRALDFLGYWTGKKKI